MLRAFGPLDDDVQTKIKYAKWRATQIHKALRSGQSPAPGPSAPRTEEEEVVSQLTTPPPWEPPALAPPPDHTEPSLPSVPTQHEGEALHTSVQGTHAREEAAPTASPAPPQEAETADCPLSVRDIAHVQKLSRWASSALDYEDIETARKHLREALIMLDAAASKQP